MNKKVRFVVSKGDLGIRIYDRKTKGYIKNEQGYCRWYKSKMIATSMVNALNSGKLHIVER
jgi:hypothetical protein